jgi:hypothetical protein
VGGDRAIVTGHVVDANGVAIPGAAVGLRATGEHTTSDAAGAFSLDVPANSTLTLAATAPGMTTTLLQQFLVSTGTSAAIEIPLLTADHFKSLVTLGANPAGGVVAIAVRSISGAPGSAAGATVDITPANLGRMMYAPDHAGMPDPDPAMTAVVAGADPYAWALGVQPHVSIMKFTLHGAPQIDLPYAVDDIIWPGTFTVDAGALTLVTLFTP